MKRHRSLQGCLAVFAATCASGGRTQPLATVERVDLERYFGEWRLIACADGGRESGIVDASEIYAPRSDGNIDITFCWRVRDFGQPEERHTFLGWITDAPANARWKVRLFPFFSASHAVIGLGDHYEWAALGHPSRKFGWILARERTMPDDSYEAVLRLFDTQGFDRRRFLKVPQLWQPAAARGAVA